MSEPLQKIRILSDQRAGHENQSVGLAEALRRRTGAEVEIIRLDGKAGLPGRLRQAADTPEPASRPDLLIACGHRTHLPLWWAGRSLGCRTVLVMKPSLPTWLFDLCLVPRHDLRHPTERGRIVPVFGALNRLPETPAAKEPHGLVLLGGPSSHHGWDADSLIRALNEVIAARPGLTWVIGDSRRTPGGTLPRLTAAGIPALTVPHQTTTPGWLPEQLMRAEEAWVTEDSVSMLHEAVTARARTGVLPMPRLVNRSRVVRAVDELVTGGFARRFADWQADGRTLPAPRPLHETARCADLVRRRFFQPTGTA